MSPAAAARSGLALLRSYWAALTFLLVVGLISISTAPVGVRAVIIAIAGTAALILVIENLARARRAGPEAEQRLKLERELAFAEAVMQAQLDASPMGILVVDAADLVQSFSARFVTFFSPPPSFAKGASDRDMLASFSAATVDPEASLARVRYLYAHPEEIADDEVLMNDGRVFERHSVELRTPAKESIGRIWFFNDVTAMRAATRSAELERNVVTALLDGLPGYFVQIDGNGRLVRWNESLRLLNGLSDEEIMGSDPFANVIEADRASMMIKIRETITIGSAELEFRITTRRGVRTIRWHGRRIVVDGKPQVLAVGIDVTDIRAGEDLLRASEERLRLIFESSTDGIILQDIESGQYVDVNSRACEMFGYTRDEFLALPPYAISVASPEEAQAQLTTIRENSPAKPKAFDWLCRAKDGHEFWTEISSRGVSFGDREVFLSTMRDATERRRAAAEVSYRDRLLHALTLSTAELVKGTAYESSMPRLLEAIGQEISGDRLLIVELTGEAEHKSGAVAYSWQRPDIEQINVQQFVAGRFGPEAAATINAWLAPLHEGTPVIAQLADATGTVREILLGAKTLSLVILPIFVDGAFWGYFGVDDTRVTRAWTPVEIEALRTFADVVGAMIARQRREASLEKSEERFRTVTETVLDGIIMLGIDGRIRFWNPSAERIFGYTATEAHGQLIDTLLAPERFRDKAASRLAMFFAAGHAALQGQTVDLEAVRKDGVEISVELAINLMRVGDDQYAVGVVRDITERKRSNGLIEQMASHDALTGLPNRRWFIDALDSEIARARRSGDTFAVLYLDLDHFKDVNDSLGHPAGDHLLQAVAQRLKASVREVDTVARFGGDEFAAIQSNMHEPASAGILAQKIVRALVEPFVIDGVEVNSGTSLGIAVYGPESPDAESLLAHADVALYLAKTEGRGTYRFYSDTMEADMRAHAALVTDLRNALALQQFFLLYEAQVDRTGRIVGLEATVRWQRPESGVVGPAEFMGAAEKSGLVNPLGMWALRETCRQTKLWLDEGIAPPSVAINLSAQQFKEPQDGQQSIAAIVVESGVPPPMLQLELRESALTEAANRYNVALLALLALGLHVTIDDFGNGYSSLEVLRSFPVWRIKIPRNFIADLSACSANAPLVRATLSLARELAIPVIAEGVTTEAQAALLSAWGCQEMQGPYFAKPLPADEVSVLLRAGRIRPLPTVSSTGKGLEMIYGEGDAPAATRTVPDVPAAPVQRT